MSLEDEIRRIVREEIERAKHRVKPPTEWPTHPPFDWQKARDTSAACQCIHGDLRARSCGHEQCSIRPPTVIYSGATQQRTGCACPPGTTSAMCPHVTCPWKPR